MSAVGEYGADQLRRIYLARQPIFDARNHVHAYEILLRDDGQVDAAGATGGITGSRVLVDGLLGVGLAEITGGRPAYLNADRELLVDGSIELLDPRHVVIGIVDHGRADPRLVPAIERLVERGFVFALDDFVYGPGVDDLLVLASIVKIDLLQHSAADLASLVDQVRPYGAALLAQKVEDQTDHDRCLELGFDYFQGSHFSRPETLERADLGIEHVNVLRLLNVIDDPNTSDPELESIFRGDVALSYKLLRMVNSAALGGRGISSIGHAIRLVGRATLYR